MHRILVSVKMGSMKTKTFAFLLLFWVAFPLLTSSSAWGWRLVTVDYVSTSEKSFVVRMGIKDGIHLGALGNFSTPYVSLVAKVIDVSLEYSRWKIQEPEATLPFQSEQVLTYHNTDENLWSTDPDRYFYLKALHNQSPKDLPPYLLAGNIDEKEKLIQLRQESRLKEFNHSVGVKNFYQTSLGESVSLANSGQTTDRKGINWEVMVERRLVYDLYMGLGLRQDQEIIDSSTVQIETSRQLVFGDISYHINQDLLIPKLMLSIGLQVGIGTSSTTVVGQPQKGRALLLPGIRVGPEFLLPYHFVIHGEVSVEGMSVKESFTDGTFQTSHMTNLRYGLGLKKYF
jgi:hypothetical protein